MARGGAYLRNISKLNVLFGVGSLLLFFALIAMIADDTIREWKRYQREFAKMETAETREKLKKEEGQIDTQKLAALEKEIEAADKQIQKQKEEVKKIRKELKALDATRYKANQEFQFARSRYAAIKYKYEDAKAHHHEEKAAEEEKALLKEEAQINQWKKELDQLDLQIEAKKKEIQGFLSQKQELEGKRDAFFKGKARLEVKLEKIKPSFTNWLVNLPMLDFIAPTRKVKQVVVEDLTEDYHFTQVPRIDRCMTCHLGIDNKEWEKAPQPFTAHPRLDLFVSSTSPHPVDKFGCTVCHNGSGQAVSFYDTAHTPRSVEQEKEWKKKYNWKAQPYVEEKMLPANLIESSCYQCHNQGSVVDIPQASKLNAGKKLFEEKSCYACHAVKGFESFQKHGPDLSMLASKTSKEWTEKWLKAPRTFRPNTKMPQFFDLSNTSTPEDMEKSNAEIAGIAAYLDKQSKPFEKIALSLPQGNAEKGKELVDNRGCLGCHSIGDWKKPNHGPDLNGIGSKVDPKWLYTWIQNPKHYWPETRMPSLRLENQEAADMVAYLMTLKNADFDKMSVPAVKISAVDTMALDQLSSQYGTVIGRQKLEAMSEEEKILYVGERAIQNYGCAGCHTIPGFEKAGKIGVELSDIGSRNVHTFEFGNVHIEHTKQGWLKTKLMNPRVYDEGKVKSRLEKLKMPHFNFSDEEADALVTFLLGLKKSEVAVKMTQQLDERELAIEKGRRMVRDFNCQGCHQVEGLGGDIAQTLPQGMNPPPLIGEGEKVWGDWLHSFLKNPSTVRHWLQVRMPTYEFNDAQADTLVKYFKALDKQDFSYNAKEAQIAKPSQEEWHAGKEIFDTFRCLQCHEAENIAGRNPADLAPDLKLARNRLQPRWVIKWLVDPQKYYPGTRMPGYWPDLQSPLPNLLGGDAKKQITALRNYLLNMDLYAETGKAESAVPEAPSEEKK